MTKINRVEISGFKSFQRKTVIPFFDGLTAIVGENGSGKSNLFDAISFVMGRRSSSLRAERLEQLIFNGGEHLSPSSMAEVTLYLDNSNGLFTPFFPDDDQPREISLGRRIAKGYASYQFMDKNCPREMIDRILETAKIDPDGHQLIAQGNLTQVIEKNPQRRREIIDEICGISAYDVKKNQAIIELKDVKRRLATDRIILAERRRRLLALERERNTALEYQRHIDEKARLNVSILKLQRQTLTQKVEAISARLAPISDQIGRLEKEVSDLDLAIENQEWELDELHENLEDDRNISLVKEVEKVRSELLRKQGEINFNRQQIKSLQETIDEIERLRTSQVPDPISSRRSKAGEALLSRKSGGVYGMISTLMTPRPGFKQAIEAALGSHINDVVVDSRETAIDCIEYLKRNQLGRVTILPLHRLIVTRKSLVSAEALKLPRIIDYAINLIEFNPKYRRAFEYVLYDTIVAEDLQAVRDVDGVRVVTLDGDLLSKGGAMSGGSPWRNPPTTSRQSSGATDSKFDTVKKRQEILSLNKAVDKLQQEIEQLSVVLSEREQQFESQQQSATQRKSVVGEKGEKLQRMREQRRHAYQEMENLRRSRTRYQQQEAEARAELDALGPEKYCESGFIEGSLDSLQQRLKETERRILQLEPINMRAIEEYDRYKKEYDLFCTRIYTLEKEKHEIELLIGQIEARKKAQFLAALNQVATYFERIFHQLFQGGRASLELEEPENINSGLIIRAHPPDKEPHLIDALSGGEQTLTAAAFVFALQEYLAGPLLILDEIDATLDKTNSNKLAKLLQGYGDHCQVIVVSHNEEMIRHAKRAYGVTMRKGISKVLSLEL
jgi:chromosome segregation protein